MYVDRNRRPDVQIIPLSCLCDERAKRHHLTRRTQALLAAAGQTEPNRRWFVLTVAVRSEMAVEKSLKLAGVEAWVPIAEIIPPRRSGRKKQWSDPVQVMAWPGYMFVKVANTAETWSNLLRVEKVLGVIGTAERPAPVSDDEVRRLKVFLENDPQAFHELTDGLDVGEMVRIVEGPFASFAGPVIDIDEAGNLHVEVTLFGRGCAVPLHLAQIERG